MATTSDPPVKAHPDPPFTYTCPLCGHVIIARSVQTIRETSEAHHFWVHSRVDTGSDIPGGGAS